MIAANAINVADQWQRVIVLRLGQFPLAGSGLFFIIPVIDTIPSGSTPALSPVAFKAEKR